MPKPQCSLRTLFAVTTVLAVFLGFVSFTGLPWTETIQLASLPILILTIIFERRLPQWISLVIAALCLYMLLTPDIQ